MSPLRKLRPILRYTSGEASLSHASGVPLEIFLSGPRYVLEGVEN